jgi:hypothetical protein
LAHRVDLAPLEPAELLGAPDGEPQLDEVTPEPMSIFSNAGHWRRNSRYSAGVQKPMTRSTPARLYQERSMRTISPACRQVHGVALEVPLGALPISRLLQRDDPGTTGVEVLHEALDRATLASGVAALEDDDDLQPLVLDVPLQLEQLDLQEPLGRLVLERP